MKRYRIVKIARADYRVMVIAPCGNVTVVDGFRRKAEAESWIVEQMMEWARGGLATSGGSLEGLG